MSFLWCVGTKQKRAVRVLVSTDAGRFKPPWTAKRIPGGYVVKDATGPKQRP